MPSSASDANALRGHMIYTDTSVGVASYYRVLLGWSFFGTSPFDRHIMSIRVPILLATLFLGLFLLLPQPTLAASERGCGVRNVISTYNGYGFARGLIVQEDRNTGKRVNAYKSIKVSDIRACTRACEGDAHCTAVTFSGIRDRKCIHFAGYDFETKRPLHLKIYNGGGTGVSAKIRSYYHGPLCRN